MTRRYRGDREDELRNALTCSSNTLNGNNGSSTYNKVPETFDIHDGPVYPHDLEDGQIHIGAAATDRWNLDDQCRDHQECIHVILFARKESLGGRWPDSEANGNIKSEQY